VGSDIRGGSRLAATPLHLWLDLIVYLAADGKEIATPKEAADHLLKEGFEL